MNSIIQTRFSTGFALVLALSVSLAFSACSHQNSASTSPTNSVSAVNVRTNATATDSLVSGYHVMREDVLQKQIDGGSILSAESGDATKFLKTSKLIDERTVYQGTFPTSDVPISTAKVDATSLVVGVPISLLGEERVLGGVITAVSNHDDINLGGLKLSDFPMLHGKLMLTALNTNTPQLILVGCASNCSEASPRVPLIAFPISAVDSQNQQLMLDLSAVGKDLDLIAMEDPTGEGTGMKSTGSTTTKFDVSLDTVVFDIDSKLVAADPVKAPAADTTLTVRWYLKSTAAFDPAYESRPATAGVGFFMTDTAAAPKIRRWSLARFGDAGIKYYLKHIPAQWQPAFASCFDEWNATFQTMFGRKIFDYEFIPEGDARNDLLVTGDIRYNIVEWDLLNLASYGGLGPSEGNEYSGETLTANVLIQGPTIMKLYTDWFKVSAQAKVLADQGKSQDAEALLHSFSQSVDASVKTAASHRLTLNHTDFKIQAELPELADPYAERNDFDELPPNVDFNTYMNGYFHDMLTHELGHNLGLRHNFRGNMGATDTGTPRSTSRSVMEYLGRRYRYLDGVGEYDIMALKYGYSGAQPTHLDWFCTDEDAFAVGSKTASAECSSNDATSDPYTFFEMRLARSIDYLTARGQSYAPVWSIADLTNELVIAQTGLLSYAVASNASATAWTNFFGKAGHPADAKAVSAYVLARVKQQLCDPNLDLVVAGKYDSASQKATRDNISAVRENTLEFFKKAGIDLGFDVNCASTSTAPIAAL